MLNAFAALRRLRLRSLADELEIERLTAERDDFRAKYKQAVADLEKQAGEIETLKALVERLRDKKNRALAEADALRPDALAMRRKRQMDRNRRKGRG